MLRKGALESGLGEIILTVLVAAVISGAMFGPLGAKIGEGFKEAEQFTDVTTQVTVSDSETLGDLSQYVFWRAWGCEKVEQETFPGLTSTNLTDDGQMPCAGAGGTIAAGAQNLYSNTGNDMEGKYSRVNFVVNETITLKTGEGFGPDNGKSAMLLGVSTGDSGKAGFSDYVRGSCTAYDPGVYRTWGDDWEKKGPPLSFQTLFFKNGGGSERIQRHGNGHTIEDLYSDRNKPVGLYCYPLPTQGTRLTKPVPETGFPDYSESTVTGSTSDVSYGSTGGNSVEVKLCPGDKGYVETRKGYPTATGESSGNIGSTNNNNLYGMIQITQMNSSCSTDGQGSQNPNEPVLNSLSSQPDGYDFNGQQVLYEESGNKVFRPDDSQGDDQMVWEGLSPGQKSVEFEVLFQDGGHFRIDVIDSNNNRVTNINTDATGTDALWMYCRTCDDSNSPPFTGSGNGDSYGVVWNYDLNTAYKIEIARNSGEISWTISDGTGVTLWSFSKDMNGDFSRVEIEAWENWASGETDDAVVRINDIRVNQ